MRTYIKASFSDRAISFIVDELILIVPALILSAIFESFMPSLKTGDGSFKLVFGLIAIIYNIWLINWRGATVGKRLMKIKVVTFSYLKPSAGKIVLRETIGKWLSSILNLGYL